MFGLVGIHDATAFFPAMGSVVRAWEQVRQTEGPIT